MSKFYGGNYMGKPNSRSCVLITGATTGIGYELAKIYARDNYNLILIARDNLKLEKVRQELDLLYNINIHILAIDLAIDNSYEEILNYVVNKNLTVDILINNAGMGSFGYLTEIENEKEIKLIDLNIKSLTMLTKLFLPSMVENEEGAILNVASTAAFCAGPKMAAYYASKAYVLNFTEAVYEEVKDKGIKVSCLCPGAVKTKFQDKAGIKKKEVANKNLMSAKDVAEIAYKSFNKGKVIIIPGLKNKVIVLLNKFIPRSRSRKIILMMNS
jgi:uncharacterized protein